MGTGLDLRPQRPTQGCEALALGTYRPIGTTDSEHAFCWLLGQVRERWPERPHARDLDPPSGPVRALRELGVCNLLLSDGQTLYAHCSTRLCMLTRRAPFGTATLIDEDWRVDFAQETTPTDVVTIVATRPLTRDEPWIDLARNAVMILRKARPCAPEPTDELVQRGHRRRDWISWKSCHPRARSRIIAPGCATSFRTSM